MLFHVTKRLRDPGRPGARYYLGRQRPEKRHQVFYLFPTQVTRHTMAILGIVCGEDLGQLSCAAVVKVTDRGIEAE